MKDRICVECGHIGQPIPQDRSSFFVDAFIWLMVTSFILMTGIVPLFIFPIGWTIYHVLKYKTTKCPKCQNLEMVSMESRKGKKKIRSLNKIKIEVYR